ncbi:MAG: LysM peptidoglycan-binding domain-containing protein [Pseudomonadales bacterium]
MAQTQNSKIAAQQPGESVAQLLAAPLRCGPQSDPENRWLASIDAADPYLPPTTIYANIWERIRAGYAIPQVDNARIQRKVDWYTNHPRHLQRVTERAQRYIYHVVESIDEAGLPMELALLPIVESAYDPFAYSHGRASGIWQFIASTGRHFGLHKNWWYDGRRDISASTEAALSYLYHLYEELDQDWLLALAAYNTGEGNVKRAIKRNRKAGKPTDFWNLKLPRETSAYVPKLLAVAKLIKQPALYNASLTDVPDTPYFESVDIGAQLDLTQAAKMAGIENDELYLLNPGFNRWATAPDGPHRLLIPVANIEQFRGALALLDPNERLPWQRYKIKHGDSLGRIAARHGTSIKLLRSANNLQSDVIHANTTLLVPAAQHPASYTTHANQIDLEAAFKSSRGGSRINYQVKAGDTLWKIARQFRVSIRDLASWNSMTPNDSLHIGRHITIWTKKSKLVKSVNTNMVRKVGYRVRSGDSLYEIAQRFSINSEDIARWNALNKDEYLQPGQALTLYIDLRNAI